METNEIDVSYLELSSGYLYLDYYTVASTEQQELEEIWTIAATYAALVDSGHESTVLQAIFMDQSGVDLGSFIIDSKWGEEYANGNMSREEYLERVIGTVEFE